MKPMDDPGLAHVESQRPSTPMGFLTPPSEPQLHWMDFHPDYVYGAKLGDGWCDAETADSTAHHRPYRPAGGDATFFPKGQKKWLVGAHWRDRITGGLTADNLIPRGGYPKTFFYDLNSPVCGAMANAVQLTQFSQGYDMSALITHAKEAFLSLAVFIKVHLLMVILSLTLLVTLVFGSIQLVQTAEKNKQLIAQVQLAALETAAANKARELALQETRQLQKQYEAMLAQQQQHLEKVTHDYERMLGEVQQTNRELLSRMQLNYSKLKKMGQ